METKRRENTSDSDATDLFSVTAYQPTVDDKCSQFGTTIHRHSHSARGALRRRLIRWSAYRSRHHPNLEQAKTIALTGASPQETPAIPVTQ